MGKGRLSFCYWHVMTSSTFVRQKHKESLLKSSFTESWKIIWEMPPPPPLSPDHLPRLNFGLEKATSGHFSTSYNLYNSQKGLDSRCPDISFMQKGGIFHWLCRYDISRKIIIFQILWMKKFQIARVEEGVKCETKIEIVRMRSRTSFYSMNRTLERAEVRSGSNH